MRVLLVSDSHGRNQNMEKVIRKASPVDLLIHLGDLEGSEGYLEAIAPCPQRLQGRMEDRRRRKMHPRKRNDRAIEYECTRRENKGEHYVKKDKYFYKKR